MVTQVVQVSAINRQVWDSTVNNGRFTGLSKPGSIVPTAWFIEYVRAAAILRPSKAGSLP